MLRRRVNALAATGAVLAALLLAGCGAGGASDSGGDQAADSGAAASEGPDASADDTTTDEAPAVVSGAVLPGTGSYVIGTDAPYGGYQLHGEPDSQPSGCTWSIQDGDGIAVVEDQGMYAFLTDVPEYVTFVTEGCPDWEQFE
jgi:hypothetical protein